MEGGWGICKVKGIYIHSHYIVCHSLVYYYLAGVFDIDKSHLKLTICPKHRDLFGVRWRSNKTNCTAPSSWCLHPTKFVRGECGITLSQSRQLFHSTGILLPVASHKCIK